MVDRLALTPKVIDSMIEGLRQVATLPDPIGEIQGMRYLPSGIQVGKMRVPLGVIGIIYESRPNVTIDAASLCLKSGNATILRGGSEAIHSNQAIACCIQQGLAVADLPAAAVQVVETTDRAAVGELIAMPKFVDVIVPRGGKGLIERISRDAKVPVIKHLDGVCHVYVDVAADLDKAIRVCDNAKTQRYSPCNAMETLLVHAAVAARCCRRWLPSTATRAWSCAAMPPPANCSAAMCWKRAKTTGSPNTMRRFWRFASSTRWMRPSSTSTTTARSTPIRSSPRTSVMRGASSPKWIPRR